MLGGSRLISSRDRRSAPGEGLATTIAQAAVEQLVGSGLDLESLGEVTYRPSVNTRIPIFGEEREHR